MIAIIALLMSILMPALGRVRKQAKAVICQSNLKQWGVCFAMYAIDNDGRFMKGWMDDPAWGYSKQWMNQLRPCYRDQGDIRLCPMTKRPTESWRRGSTFHAWASFGETGDSAVMDGDYGSYGMNDWAYNPPSLNEDELYLPEGTGGYSKGSWYWRGPGVRNPHNIPLFFDCIWTDAWPHHTNEPTLFEDYALMTDLSGQQMQRVCIKRHNDGINSLFLDYSVRKVGLKELWTLKWNPHFDTDGPSTIAGGMTPDAWPPWLRKFKDY